MMIGDYDIKIASGILELRSGQSYINLQQFIYKVSSDGWVKLQVALIPLPRPAVFDLVFRLTKEGDSSTTRAWLGAAVFGGKARTPSGMPHCGYH